MEQIERVIKKSGERDCLLALQTHINFELGQIDKARESNAQFSAKNPGHPVAFQHDAMIKLSDGDVGAAIDRLQDAMDAIKSNEIPTLFASTFRMVGSVLLAGGHLLAARAHLQFAAMLKEGQDQELNQLIARSYRIPNAPLVLSDDFRLQPAPADVEWAGKYENVGRAMNRGQFRLALKILNRIDENWPNQVQVLRSIAILNSMLANEEEMSGSWKRLARLEQLPHWQAVECEAISLLFDQEEPSGMIPVVSLRSNLKDLDVAFQLLSANTRFSQTREVEEDPFEEGARSTVCFSCP